MIKAAYVHIPFCKSICSYCDFCKFLYNKKWVTVYLDTLKKEIKDRYLDDVVDTLYIGGGTPSCLTIPDLRRLFNILSLIKRSQKAEVTFECNIEDITEELLCLLKYNGVNRLSIGIESFKAKNLEFMKRPILDFKEVKAKITLCRKYNFNNINLDLIYALPNETLKDVKNDLKCLLKLNPEHISTYSLMIEDHTLAKVLETENIDEELDYNMFLEINKTLKDYDYIHYEVSNFAKKGYESKHNLTYWLNNEYYGFGLGASGYIEDIRYNNTKSLKEYLLGNYVASEEIVKGQDKMNYELMLNLRLTKGLNMKQFKEKYGLDVESVYDLKKLYKNKDLIKKKGNIYINPGKIYVMNEILLKII